MRNCVNEGSPFYNFDRMVYSPYGLTRDEIAISEESLQEKTAGREVADDDALEQEN